jgi:hypothetical protein
MKQAIASMREKYWLTLLFCSIFLGMLGACGHMQLITEYDTKVFEETLRIGGRVDLFYGQMLEVPDQERKYAKYANQYVELESEIRTLYRRNASRPLNEDSSRIVLQILTFWQQYKQKHHTNNAYPDAALDRERFARLFNAAAIAEEVKKLSPDEFKPASQRN